MTDREADTVCGRREDVGACLSESVNQVSQSDQRSTWRLSRSDEQQDRVEPSSGLGHRAGRTGRKGTADGGGGQSSAYINDFFDARQNDRLATSERDRGAPTRPWL